MICKETKRKVQLISKIKTTVFRYITEKIVLITKVHDTLYSLILLREQDVSFVFNTILSNYVNTEF